MSLAIYDGTDVELALVDCNAWSAIEPQVSEGSWIKGEWLEGLEVLGDFSLSSSEELEELGLTFGDLAMLVLQLRHLHLASLGERVEFR